MICNGTESSTRILVCILHRIDRVAFTPRGRGGRLSDAWTLHTCWGGTYGMGDGDGDESTSYCLFHLCISACMSWEQGLSESGKSKRLDTGQATDDKRVNRSFKKRQCRKWRECRWNWSFIIEAFNTPFFCRYVVQSDMRMLWWRRGVVRKFSHAFTFLISSFKSYFVDIQMDTSKANVRHKFGRVSMAV